MTSAHPPGRGKMLAASVAEAAALFESDTAAAEKCAIEILKRSPGQAQALALLVNTRRKANDLQGGRDLLQAFAAEAPNLATIQYELGLLQIELKNIDGAIAALSRVVELEPTRAEAWRVLGNALVEADRSQEAAHAYAKHLESGGGDLQRLEGMALGGDDQLPAAEKALCEWLSARPTDVTALHFLGSVYIRLKRYEDAEAQLLKALKLAPHFLHARWMLAGTYYHRGNWPMTLVHVEALLKANPDKSDYMDLKAYSLLYMGELEESIRCYEELVSRNPSSPENWKSYAYALKAVGRQKDAIAAYRKAIALRPDYGHAYWGLANLKTFHFDPREIGAMQDLLQSPSNDWNGRSQMQFALGKAFEDSKQYETAFKLYEKANALVRTHVPHNANEWTRFVQRSKAVFTPAFFRERTGWGSPALDPIFVIGMPRSGSTLIEQILASHSLVEGTNELKLLDSVARCARSNARRSDYPEELRDLGATEVAAAAKRYLELASTHRKTRRPFFIDKMPSNLHHVGFIHLVFPNAKIIDARRNPLASGVATFKHYFHQLYSAAFDLADIGHYYRNYVELMAHFDTVLPGRIHRVFYERMVQETDAEIRALLAYCGLPPEEACFRFYETKRAVLTPSSEQVRQPIFKDSLDLWRQYERWLEPLKSSLGDVLDHYPDVPDFERQALAATQWNVSTQSDGLRATGQGR